jgi:hypothetical protein
MLFSPALVTAAPGSGTTTPDPFQSGQQTDAATSQVTSSLGGNAYVVSPSRSVLFSTGYLNARFSAGLEYHVSPRLRIFWNLGAGYNQMRGGLPTSTLIATAGYLSEDATMGMSYSLAPRTALEIATHSSHVAGSLGRYYLETTDVSLLHRFSPHWFGTVHVGPSFVVRTSRSLFSSALPGTVPSYSTMGSFGYTSGGHAVTVSYSRAPTDLSGLGSTSSGIATASWEWHPVAVPWWVGAAGGRQSMSRGTAGTIEYWQGHFNLGRVISRQFAVVFTLGYLGRPAAITNAIGMQDLTGISGRITLLWTPHRTLPGSGLNTRSSSTESRNRAEDVP